MAYGIHGFFGLALLHQADNRIQYHHRQDNNGVHPVTQQRCNDCRPKQDIDQNIVEVQQKAHQETMPRWLREGICAMLVQPLRCSLPRQTPGIAVKIDQYFGAITAVPQRGHCRRSSVESGPVPCFLLTPMET